MTQPETAVGGGNDTVVAAEPTLENRLTAAMEFDEQELPGDAEEGGENLPLEAPAPEDALELEADDVGDDDLPPIQPPVSWTAEEKAEFSQLPRAMQETLARRESEREKFVQSKAREVKEVQSRTQSQAAQLLQSQNQKHMAALQAILPQVPQMPDPYLQVNDPMAYADQVAYVQNVMAQRDYIAQQIDAVQQQMAFTEQTVAQHASAEMQQTLQEAFPEILDPANTDLRNALTATALGMGYSNDILGKADATDILALRVAHEWRDKASKYDALMARKMEGVRAAKSLPKVSKPGQPQGKGAVANQQYQRDREAMRKGDSDAAARAIARFL